MKAKDNWLKKLYDQNKILIYSPDIDFDPKYQIQGHSGFLTILRKIQ